MSKRLGYGRRTAVVLVTALAPGACGLADAAPMPEQSVRERPAPSSADVCPAGIAVELPRAARESSGLARSAGRPTVLWTHNDQGNGPELIAVDDQGRLLQQVELSVDAVDWEDIESTACDAGSCLYVGDIGDNDGERASIAVHVVVEPGEDAREASPQQTLRARYADGPRDAEALFAMPGGDIYIVTKGRRNDIALYRYPRPQQPGETMELARVRTLFPEPEDDDDRVTAATSSPNGLWIALRTYRTLYVYRAEALLSGAPLTPVTVDLEPLSEAQGEGLAMADDGTVWLSSEAANRRSSPELNTLRCTLPGR